MKKIFHYHLKKKLKIESKWGLQKIGEIITEQPKSKIKVGTAKDVISGTYPFFTSGENVLAFNDFLLDGENIYLSTGGNAIVKYFDGKAAYSTDTFAIKGVNEGEVKTKFIFHLLNSIIASINELYFKGVGLKHLQKPDFRNIKIPVPPLKIQQKIIDEIEVLESQELRNNIDTRKFNQDIQNIFNQSKTGSSIKFSSIATLEYGKPLNAMDRKKGKYLVMGSNGVIDTHTEFLIKAPCIIIGRKGSAGKVKYVETDCFPIDTTFYVSLDTKKADIKYFYYLSLRLNLEQLAKGKGIGVPGLNRNNVHNLNISIPSIAEQKKIVKEIEKIETEINKLEAQIKTIPAQKQAILKKYL